MIYLDLFLGFLQVGCFAFGGAYGAIPLIRDVVLSYGWMNDEMLAYMIAISESTPGPIMVNLATYVGTEQAGMLGAAVATLAVVLPSFIIIVLITAVMQAVIKNKYVQAALRGLKPCIIGIVSATGVYMTAQHGMVDLRAALLTIVLAVIMFGAKPLVNKKVSPISLIVVSAVLGAVVYSI